MPRPLTPAHLAAIDREAAEYSELLDKVVGEAREVLADEDGVPAVAQLTTAFLHIDQRKLAAVAATAVLRLARGGTPNA